MDKKAYLEDSEQGAFLSHQIFLFFAILRYHLLCLKHFEWLHTALFFLNSFDKIAMIFFASSTNIHRLPHSTKESSEASLCWICLCQYPLRSTEGFRLSANEAIPCIAAVELDGVRLEDI